MPDRSPPLSARELVRVIAGFIALTVLLTYPQIRLMSSHMAEHYDTLFSVWRLAWIAHQLPLDARHLFDANIFYPERHTLAYSDALLLPAALGSPLIWCGVNEIAVHNMLVLFSFAACGVAMYVLCRELTGSAAAAWFGGVVFAFQPYRFGHYAQLELLWGWPIPLAFWALDRVFRTRRVRDGAWLGVFVAAQALSCLYYAVFLITALTILTLVLIAGSRRSELPGLLRAGLAAGAVAAVLIIPYALPYVAGGRTVGIRSEAEVLQWSPTFENFVAVLPRNWLYGRSMGYRASLEGIMFPGLVAMALASVGAWPPFTRRRAAYLVLLVVAVDLSLGSHGVLYGTLYRTVWVYRGLRVPARMFVVVSAALAVLGAEGVRRLLARIPLPPAKIAAGLLLIGFVLVESATIPIELKPVPKPAALYTWLKSQPPAVVMEWPTPHASSLYETHEPRYMYNSTFHWQRLVNGYSGFYPPSFILFLEAMDSFPSPRAIAYLRGLSVRFVILHSDFDPGRYVDARNTLGRASDLRLVLVERQGADEIAVYTLPE